MMTKLSHAEIRATQVTGMVTDIEIELGKLIYWNRSTEDALHPLVLANRRKIRLLFLLLVMFILGGLAGALGFSYAGYAATVSLAILLTRWQACRHSRTWASRFPDEPSRQLIAACSDVPRPAA